LVATATAKTGHPFDGKVLNGVMSVGEESTVTARRMLSSNSGNAYGMVRALLRSNGLKRRVDWGVISKHFERKSGEKEVNTALSFLGASVSDRFNRG
jgi:hypothetical protein